jgi:uncharacterized membrane protein
MNTYTSTYSWEKGNYIYSAVGAASPLLWLREGWKDLAATPARSILLGGSFTLLCAAAYAVASALPMFSASLLVLLLLVSPYFAAMAYSIARQREQMQEPSVKVSFTDVRKQALSLGLFSIFCAIIVAAWVRLSSIAFALFYGTLGASSSEIARVWSGDYGSLAMLVFLALASLVLALTLFAVGAVTLPTIADRNSNIVDALHSGLRKFRINAATMLVWMLVLAVSIGIALFSRLALMPIIFPLLAYATWHSYRHLSASQDAGKYPV